jgi:uncharacterized glyoxalase superfamily protein PhnB
MIMSRGSLVIEFFPYPDLDPYSSSFSACVRVMDADALFKAWQEAGLASQGIPRLTAPKNEDFGFRMFACVDINGSLLRVLTPL